MEKNHVDEIMSHMQVASKKAAIVGFGPLPVRMGVEGSRSGSRETCRGPRIHRLDSVTPVQQINSEIPFLRDRVNASSASGTSQG